MPIAPFAITIFDFPVDHSRSTAQLHFSTFGFNSNLTFGKCFS